MIDMRWSGLDAPVLPGHGGIEGDWWLAWNVDPQVLLPAALLAFWYVSGARSMGRQRHPLSRSLLFMTGLVVNLLAMESPIDRLGEHHFAFHMIQHELFVLVGVPLMLLGAPTIPVLRGMPKRLQRLLGRLLFRSPAWHRLTRILTYPPFALLQMLFVLYGWHFAPGWFDAALRNDAIHDVQHVSFLVAGGLFWWNVIDPWPLRSRLPYGARMLYIMALMIPRALLGATLVYASQPYYRAYSEVRPIISIDPLEDQVLGGLIMWVPGESLHLVALGIVFFVWYGKSQLTAGQVYPSPVRQGKGSNR